MFKVPSTMGRDNAEKSEGKISKNPCQQQKSLVKNVHQEYTTLKANFSCAPNQ
jgi:hypothetical protein